MRKRKTDHSDAIFITVLIAALLVAVGVGIWWMWPVLVDPPAEVARTEPEPPAPVVAVPPTPVAPKPVPQAEEPSFAPYGEPLETVEKLMERRKAAFGLDESVDMVVKPEESIQVGEVTVPMSEILEKIRIKEGGVVESDLSPESAADADRNRWERLFSRLKRAETRFRELEKEMAGPETAPPPDAVRSRIDEMNALAEDLDTFEDYKETLSRQVETGDILKSPSVRTELERHVANLEARAEKLTDALHAAATARSGKDTGDDPEETLKRIAERHDEISTILADPPPDTPPETLLDLARERAEIADTAKGYRTLERLRKTIAEDRRLLTETEEEIARQLKERLTELRIARDGLENELTSRMLPEAEIDIYGIYVVQPGDNIWNIHFRFLTEYFGHRGIVIRPTADEPDDRGISSGVGKILKFSEKMVYIYNVREGRLEEDLHLIHPLSKIVVFNMGRALGLLKQLNAEDIRHIRFDGETLWLPAG